MAMSAKEIREWLSRFDDDHLISIDDGGLSLVDNDDTDDCCEVGGIRD